MKFESGWYLASTASIARKHNKTLGVIHNTSNLNKGFYTDRLSAGVPFCLDCEVFSNKFDEAQWLKAVERAELYAATCLFVVVPDVVADAAATLQRFKQYRPLIKNLPAAFVSQDGIELLADSIPWDDFSAVFIGGTDKHKLGASGRWVMQEARERGKWVHVGRVNSPSRIVQLWEADSWDGTHLGFNPSDASRFHAAVLQARLMKKSNTFLEKIK